MLQKGFSKVGLLVMLVAVVGGGYLLLTNKTAAPSVESPSQPEQGGMSLLLQESGGTLPVEGDMSTWTTYRNESCGFEVKYPSGYQAFRPMGDCGRVDDGNWDHETMNMMNMAGCEPPLHVRDTAGCQLHDISVMRSVMMGGRERGMIEHEGEGTTRTEAMLGGLTGEKLTYRGDDGTMQAVVQAKDSRGIWYRYTMSYHRNDQVQAEETLDRIISNFRFLP